MIALSVFTSVSFACPDDGSATLGRIEVEQSVVNGNASYIMRGYTTDDQYVHFERKLLADGVLYGFTSNEDGYIFINKYKDSCKL